MRLIYAYDEILPSSATDTEQVVNTVSALGQDGVQVDLVVPQSKGCPVPDVGTLASYYQVDGPFRVLTVPAWFDAMRPLQKVAHAFRVKGALAPGRDAVWYTRNLPCLVAGLNAGFDVAYEHWRPWPRQYPPLEPVLRALMGHPRFLGAILHSDYARESFERIGVPGARLVTIHNGYDPRRMEPRRTREQARAALGLPVDARVAVYAGRVHENKGIDSLLALARRCPDVTLLLVGSEGEGAVERRARSLPNVHVVPWQRFSDTVAYLYAADVLLLPLTVAPLEVHNTSALPMKLFQYLASARPVLAPRAPDLLELLNADNAFLVPPDDEEAAVFTLRTVLADPGLRDRVAAAGFQTAEALTWSRRAQRIRAFLEERLAARGVPQAASTWSGRQWALRSARWARGALRGVGQA